MQIYFTARKQWLCGDLLYLHRPLWSKRLIIITGGRLRRRGEERRDSQSECLCVEQGCGWRYLHTLKRYRRAQGSLTSPHTVITASYRPSQRAELLQLHWGSALHAARLCPPPLQPSALLSLLWSSTHAAAISAPQTALSPPPPPPPPASAPTRPPCRTPRRPRASAGWAGPATRWWQYASASF